MAVFHVVLALVLFPDSVEILGLELSSFVVLLCC